TPFQAASRSAPSSSRGRTCNVLAPICTSAVLAFRRLRNQSGSRGAPDAVPQTRNPSAVSRYRTQVECSTPVRRPGAVIIKTVMCLLWLASRPSDTRYIQTTIWFPMRCILCLNVVMVSRRLLQRRYEPHHIVDVPLALRALPPFVKVQFLGN